MDSATPRGYRESHPVEISGVYEYVLKRCLLARLAPEDAEDIGQDVALWILRHRPLLPPLDEPWLRRVSRIFILRFWRARRIRSLREFEALRRSRANYPIADTAAGLDLKLSLKELERDLPPVEALLLHFVRRGYTFAEASVRAGVPPGSANFRRNVLQRWLMDRLKLGNSLLPTKRAP